MVDHVLTLAVSGDPDAFDRLVTPHVRVLRRVAYLHAPSVDVDDVVQDALTRAWSHLSELRAGASLRAWLVAITANIARNRTRGASRREKWELAEGARTPTTAASAEDEAVSPGLAKEVLTAVEALPSGQRDVVAYRYFLDLSESETAEALRIPLGTVKSRLSRATATLRSALKEARP